LELVQSFFGINLGIKDLYVTNVNSNFGFRKPPFAQNYFCDDRDIRYSGTITFGNESQTDVRVIGAYDYLQSQKFYMRDYGIEIFSYVLALYLLATVLIPYLFSTKLGKHDQQPKMYCRCTRRDLP